MKAALAARGISADRALVAPAPGLLFAGDVDLSALVLKPAVPSWPTVWKSKFYGAFGRVIAEK